MKASLVVVKAKKLLKLFNENGFFSSVLLLRFVLLSITSLKTQTHQSYYFPWRVNATVTLR